MKLNICKNAIYKRIHIQTNIHHKSSRKQLMSSPPMLELFIVPNEKERKHAKTRGKGKQ